MNKQVIIDRLGSLEPLLADKYPLTELALFGSYTRNEQTEDNCMDSHYRRPHL